MNQTDLRTILRGSHLRLSQPRLLIYEQLSVAASPLSPQEIYRYLLKKEQKIGLTSIYRSLDLFESLGIAFKIALGPQVKYKLCESGDHHHHIVCKTCGHVVELKFCDLPRWSKKVMESTGYEVTDHQLNFYGICGLCRKKA